jgi:glycerol-3-phosphate dehydrogenase
MVGAPPPSRVDLLVVGGGINGAAVARDAAFRGLATMIVDAEDFGAGTSAASSRMIHGGIRYLENGEIRLVRESLREREYLLATAPHLVAPYPLLIPFYTHNHRHPLTLMAGMALYDALSLDKSSPWHRLLTRADLARAFPGMHRDGLRGAALYHDAQAPNVERLVIEQILDIVAMGGSALNHCKVVGAATRGRELDVVLAPTGPESSGVEYVVRCSAVVNAAGPWVDDVLATTGYAGPRRLIGGTKGSHFTVPAFAGAPTTAVHYEARADGRAVLVLPQPHGRYLIGSTDVFYDDEPQSAVCTDEEIDYLLAEVNALFPQARLDRDDVLHSYSGVRPLPFSPDTDSSAAVSRGHHVLPHPDVPGLFSVVGGKLTTHRALGEIAVDAVLGHLGRVSARSWSNPLGARRHRQGPRARSFTTRIALPGARCANWPGFRDAFAASGEVAEPVRARLLAMYGTRASRVLALAEAEGLADRLTSVDDLLAAEVVIALREERAETLTDVMARRLLLTRRDDVGWAAAAEVAAVCAHERGWDTARTERELEAFRRWAITTLRPRDVPARAGSGTEQPTAGG